METQLKNAYSGRLSPGGTKTYDLSLAFEQQNEANLVNSLLKEEPLPSFDNESDEEDDAELDRIEKEQAEQGNQQVVQQQQNFNWNNVDEIQKLSESNQELRATVVEQKDELEELHVLLEALEPIPGIDVEALMDVMQGTEVVDQDIRDTKIVNQAKKIRALTVALNREKGKSASSTAKVEQLQKELDALSSAKARAAAIKSSKARSSNNNNNNSTSAAAADAAEASKKVEELRVKLATANTELKRYQKALAKEIGDGFSITEVMSEAGNWKGRAETIQALRAKLKRAQQKSLSSEKSTAPSPSAVVDSRVTEDLKSIRVQKQKEADSLMKENARLLEEKQTVVRKMEAARSRARVLEKDTTKHKNQVKVLLEKSGTDDAVIDALQLELDNLRVDMQELKASRNAAPRSVTKKAVMAQESYMEVHRLEKIRMEQSSQLKRQQRIIDSLQNDLEKKREPGIARDQSELLQEKDAQIARLRQQIQEKTVSHAATPPSDERAKELEEENTELKEENNFLGEELNKLKQRYKDLMTRKVTE